MHDEIPTSVKSPEEVETIGAIMRDVKKDELLVPMAVELKVGGSWGLARKQSFSEAMAEATAPPLTSN